MRQSSAGRENFAEPLRLAGHPRVCGAHRIRDGLGGLVARVDAEHLGDDVMHPSHVLFQAGPFRTVGLIQLADDRADAVRVISLQALDVRASLLTDVVRQDAEEAGQRTVRVLLDAVQALAVGDGTLGISEGPGAFCGDLGRVLPFLRVREAEHRLQVVRPATIDGGRSVGRPDVGCCAAAAI